MKFNAAFWRWFGKSVVTDDNGNPKVVYHGSPFKNITKFYSIGIHFFTPEKKYATVYADKKGTKGKIYTVYLSIQHPFDPLIQEDIDYYNNEYVPWLKSKGTYHDPWELKLGDNIPFQWADHFVRFLWRMKRLGNKYYDGILVDEGGFDEAAGTIAPLAIVPLEPNQIKSAFNNDGTYDLDDDDIRSNPRRGRR